MNTPTPKSEFQRTVAGRFGLLPSFFASSPDAPEVIEKLWTFAEAAYLDNPIPSLFKERLFVYLSRFCEVRYCLVRHCAFLLGYGRASGDPAAKPQTVAEVIRLLKTVPPWRRDDAWLVALEAYPVALDWPEAETEAEDMLFQASALLFTEPARADRPRQAVKRVLGGQRFEYLNALLAFIRTAHYWTQVHPDLPLEADSKALLEAHGELARLILEDPEASHADMGGRLFAELEELRGLHERAELRRAKEVLERTLAQKELLLKEVNHRVKNSLQIVSSILQLQLAEISNPESAAAVQKAASRVMAIAAVHEDLYTGDDVQLVALDQLLERMSQNLGMALGCPDGIKTDLGQIEIPTDMAVPLALMVNELVANAVKFAGPPCTVSLKVGPPGHFTLSVSDNGSGPAGERSGMGLRILDGLTRQLGARMETNLGPRGYEVSVVVPWQ